MARLPCAAMSLSVSFEPEARKAAQASSTSLIEPLPVKQGLSSTLAADPAGGRGCGGRVGRDEDWRLRLIGRSLRIFGKHGGG